MIVLESHIVGQDHEQLRLVDYCIGIFESIPTKNAVKKLIKKHGLIHNGELAQGGKWIQCGDKIDRIAIKGSLPKPYPLAISIEYEDHDLLIVNKPAGIPVSGNQYRTLENCCVEYANTNNDINNLPWPLPAHRLDAATTGLVIFAKTANCRRAFDKLFQKHEIQKTYHAIVHGNVENSNVTTPIKGKSAISEISVIKQINSLKSGFLSLVQLKPLTGREHQLRIHCSSIGNAIVGDKLYGDKNNTITHKGLMLCSTQLEFNHPITSKKLVIGIRIPYKFDTLLQREERRWNKFNS